MKKALVSLLAALACTPALAADERMVFPEGFRYWDHVKSMVINKGHPLHDAVGGMHHIYANKAAMKGYRSGNKFKDGSVIVFDLFEAVDKDNAISEGVRKAVIVMEKSQAKYAATGGWGYEVFDPATQKGTLDAKGVEGCHNCHMAQKDSGFVFSRLRD